MAAPASAQLPTALPDHWPSWPDPSPFHCPSSGRCPMPGAAPVPQLPSGVVGWALAAVSCPHRSWDTEQSPWCYGHPAPREQAAEFKSSLSPPKITHHYHREHSPPQPTFHHLFPFHCCLSQYALNQFYSTVFPPLTATDPTSLVYYLGHLCFCSIKHWAR